MTQDLCTGDGLCVEICPEIFFMHDDGLAYVKSEFDPSGMQNEMPKHRMGGEDGLVSFEDRLLESVIESAEECPGECIFIEEPK